jgi:DNA mismatch repair protein MutS2
LLACDTHTAIGRDRAVVLLPSRDAEEIQQTLRETRQARAALTTSGPPPWETIPDVRATLDAIRVAGSVAEGPELVGLIPVMDAAARLRAYGRGIADTAPEVSLAFAALPIEKSLADVLRRSLEDDGSVKDEASPALVRLRRRVRTLRKDIVKLLEGHFQSPGAQETFQERYVTVRHGRYVLPVAAGAKGRVRGIVHDRSQSGATLFVEPDSAVEANNDLVQAAREEDAEVLRILGALTDEVRASLPALAQLIEGIGELDLIFARGQLAEDMRAIEPDVTDERTVALEAARNPLLLAQSWKNPERAVVPVDLELTAARPLLVITGPNAGGKTVALKTLALLSLMAQSGLHVPARAARLPIFSQVFAIIGDDQSVAENLSTFSAFVKQLRDVLAQVDDRSLVLLDELGAGTDPDDGAALAQAVLEALGERGALTVASTHLEPLKGFASSHPRARNASVEFDQERLAPTFRLLYDRPGQSYALDIAARLGLPPALIARAHSYRSTEQQALQELLARLDDRDRRDAERTALIDKREAESAGLLARAESDLAAAEQTARDVVAAAKAESRKLIGELRRAVNDEWEQLRRGEKSRTALARTGARVKDLARTAESLPDTGHDGVSAAPGDEVEVAHLGLRGEVLASEGGTATVRAGALTVKVPIQGLRVVRAGPPRAKDLPSGARSPARINSGDRARETVSAELHLIGRTSDDARDLLEKYLDDAFLAGLNSVRIIHGKGTGALRRAVEDVLSGHPLVVEHRPGAAHEGGTGATVALMSQS